MSVQKQKNLHGHDDDNQDVETDTHQARSNYHHLLLARSLVPLLPLCRNIIMAIIIITTTATTTTYVALESLSFSHLAILADKLRFARRVWKLFCQLLAVAFFPKSSSSSSSSSLHLPTCHFVLPHLIILLTVLTFPFLSSPLPQLYFVAQRSNYLSRCRMQISQRVDARRSKAATSLFLIPLPKLELSQSRSFPPKSTSLFTFFPPFLFLTFVVIIIIIISRPPNQSILILT